MLLDVRTIFIILALLCIMAALAVFVLHIGRLQSDGMLKWVIGYTFQSLAWVSFGLRGFIPDYLSIVAGNVLFIASYSMIYMAVCEFQSRTYNRIIAFSPPILIFFFFQANMDNLSNRVVSYAVVCSLQAGVIAWILFRNAAASERRSQWLLGAAFIGLLIIKISRLFEGLFIGDVTIFATTTYRTVQVLAESCIVFFMGIGFLLMLRDRSAADLIESEEKYAKAFATNPAAIALTGLDDGLFLDVNDTWIKLNGYNRIEVIGQSARKLPIWPTVEAANRFVQVLRDKGLLSGWEQKFRNKSGDVYIAQMSAQVLTIQGKKVILSTLVDITERKMAEDSLANQTAQLQERTAQLEEINKELESFSYSVSHDLKAPLRAIEGYSRMLLKKDANELSEDTIRKLDVICSNTAKMNVLIDDLLSFSKMLKSSITISEINMDKLVKETWAEIQAANTERELEFKITNILPGKGDPALIRQVLFNLFSNAVKFTKTRTPGIIKVSCHRENGNAVFCIEDNGVGFDMAYYDKLFGVFQRSHSHEQYEGTGVGLAIVHRIINRHGGHVWAEGEVGRGAKFYFTLPTP